MPEADREPGDRERVEQARLRQLIWFDVATACTAVATMSAAYVLIDRNGWFLVLSVLVTVSGAMMAAGLRPLRRGELAAAAAWLAAANWSIALAASAIATFAWPLMALAGLLPAVFAAPYVATARLRSYVAVSLAVSVGVVALGSLQDFAKFSEALPAWLRTATVIFFTPFLAGMVLIAALQHSSRLRSALDAAIGANEALRASRSRLVSAADDERRRVERDLHDGAQQRLIALGIRLRAVQETCRTDAERAIGELRELREEVRAAHRELRELAQGVYPPVLTRHGLPDALAAAADRCPIEVDVCVDGRQRYRPEVEATVYFCCVEALQNVVKHAGRAARATIVVATADGQVDFAISDDGRGFVDASPAGAGLANLRDRVGALGGELAVFSQPGEGTTVRGSLPLGEAG